MAAETSITGPWKETLERLIRLPGRVLEAMQRATRENAAGLVGYTKEYVIQQKGALAKPLHPFTLAQRAVGGGKGSPKRLINHADLLGAIGSAMAADGLSARVGILDKESHAHGDLSIGAIARIQTNGCIIPVTPKMRAWMAAQGFPLRNDTTHLVIPPSPFIRPAFDEYRDTIREHYRKRFFEAVKSGLKGAEG